MRSPIRLLAGAGIAALLAWDLGAAVWLYVAWPDRAAARMTRQHGATADPAPASTTSRLTWHGGAR